MVPVGKVARLQGQKGVASGVWLSEFLVESGIEEGQGLRPGAGVWGQAVHTVCVRPGVSCLSVVVSVFSCCES